MQTTTHKHAAVAHYRVDDGKHRIDRLPCLSVKDQSHELQPLSAPLVKIIAAVGWQNHCVVVDLPTAVHGSRRLELNGMRVPLLEALSKQMTSVAARNSV
jgi:hypothetical protein